MISRSAIAAALLLGACSKADHVARFVQKVSTMNHAISPGSHGSTTRNEPPKVEGKVTDPVCGMAVDPARAAAKRELDGQTFYFCGTGCASKFDGDPVGHAERSGGSSTRRGCCG